MAFNIGKIIKEAREKEGLKLIDVKNKTGISISFLSDIEGGRRKPSTENAVKIAAALGLDVKLLLDERSNSILNYLHELTNNEDAAIRALQQNEDLIVSNGLTKEDLENIKLFEYAKGLGLSNDELKEAIDFIAKMKKKGKKD